MARTSGSPTDKALPQDQPAAAVRHLNQEQLARRWGISPRTLERHRWLGIGVAYLKLQGKVAYRLEDILAYEDQQLRGGR